MGGAILTIAVLTMLGGLGTLLYVPFARGRRWKMFKLSLALFAGSFVLAGVGGALQVDEEAEKERIAGGFESVTDMREAKKLGIATNAEYQVHLEMEAERDAAEAERRAKEEAEKAAQCRQELGCWADKHWADASVRCESVVERLAKYDFQWTDGVLEPKFSHYRWKSRKAGIVTYIGDKIKLQNGFGAWQHHVYECDYDTAKKIVVDVRASPGRL